MERIKGYVDHIIYRNEENGYTVFVLIEDKEEITVVGMFQGIDQGEMLEVEGSVHEHPVYGHQLKMETYQILPPEDMVSMERYLGSGAIKGIGVALAKRIVKYFKNETFRIIEEEPERLAEVKGITLKKAREISEQVEEKKDMRQVMIYLQKYGISNTLSMKIYEKYNAGIYDIMQQNPYRLAEDIHGVGFKMADEIAKKIGIHTDSDYRIRSALLYLLLEAAGQGHIYLPQTLLLKRGAQLLGLEPEILEPQVLNLNMDKKLIVKKGKDDAQVYSLTSYYAELNCARMLRELNVSMDIQSEESDKILKRMYDRIKRMEAKQGLALDELQRKAVTESMRNGLFILTGGPGTGKTTTINMMIQLFEEEEMDILLAAPTGRAAKRMTETTGYEARTIHRLLELNGAVMEEGGKASFERNENNPLETDVVIIDEMSMVDIYLFQALLKAIAIGTRLIMVGDMNQLPSVGPGEVLKDLIQSSEIPVIHLEKIFRQAEESDIVLNAHCINRGEHLRLDNKSKDFFFLERKDVNVIYKHMIQLIQEKLPPYVNTSSLEIQVLTPMRKGPLGVETLNKILQEYLNTKDGKKEEYQQGEILFRQGDKVMQTKNNYQIEWQIESKYGIPVDKGIGVFNGDTGIIQKIDNYAQTITVEFEEQRKVIYPFTQLDELELAYAITIHKSQGSEYPAIIMPLLAGPKMLFNRNLLYTGVTRAKSCVTILGSKLTLEEMVENENKQQRYTSLAQRISEIEENFGN